MRKNRKNRKGRRVAVRPYVSVRGATKQAVRAAAEERGISQSELVRQALDADPAFRAYMAGPDVGGGAGGA
jgi:hypothetical protein